PWPWRPAGSPGKSVRDWLSLYAENVPASTVTFSWERACRCQIDERFVSFCELMVRPKTLNVEFSSTWLVRFAVALWPTSRSNGGMADTDVVALTRRSATSFVVKMYVTSASYDEV